MSCRILLLLLAMLVPALAVEDGELALWQRVAALGQDALGQDYNDGFVRFGADSGTTSATVQEVDGQPFHRSLRLAIVGETRIQPGHFAQVKFPFPVGIRTGEVVVVAFFARCVATREETGVGRVTYAVQKVSAPWNRLGAAPGLGGDAGLGPQWQLVTEALAAEKDYTAGDMGMWFDFNVPQQQVEVAGVLVRRLPPGTDLAGLPLVKPSYPGRATDAAWRTAARERIQAIRTAPLTIAVRDRSGAAVAGARIEVEQITTDFTWGTVISRPLWESARWQVLPDGSCQLRDPATADEESDDRARWEIVRSVFNAVTVDKINGWGFNAESSAVPLDDSRKELGRANDRRLYDHLAKTVIGPDLQELRRLGHQVHGAHLVWPAFRRTNWALARYKDSPGALRLAVERYVDTVAATWAGLLDSANACNEPLNNTDYTDLCGKDAMLDWFAAGARRLPGAKLTLNEHSILSAGGILSDRHERLEAWARFLLEHKAPIASLGFQGHFHEKALTGPERVLALLDRFAALGLRIRITEFDCDTTDAQLQADFTRDFLTAVFSHPAVESVHLWGFWAGDHWRPDAALWNRDWTIKPAGAAFVELVRRQWRTRASLTTANDGGASLRAFHGRLRVTATTATGTVSREVQVTAAGARCDLALP